MLGVSVILSKVPLSIWVAAGAAALMAIPLGVQTVRLDSMTKSKERWELLVTHPETGYIARLTTCRGNVAGLTSALDRQNEAVADLEADSAERIAEAEREAEAARDEIARVRARADRTINRPIIGETTCERVIDVYSAYLEELTQ